MVPPSGTVTFLLTDIEGSTRRWEVDAEAMRIALAAHDEVLRESVGAFGGYLFKHTGDGIAAAFSSANAAVAAAARAQRELELPVRMGLATGEAQVFEGDYFAPVLNRAARVMAAGHGGQVLVSGSTALLLSGVDLLDLGEHRLRDLSELERLYQVLGDGLGAEFPALRTADVVAGNLPVPLSGLVGRATDVKELVELVRTRRLVTLVGVGGVGKTRLAIQVGAELVSQFPGGVWMVELAPVGDPHAVADVLASVLGVATQADVDVSRSIASALSGQPLLIVLDNCEHVLDATAATVETILSHTELVHVLATSREGLRIAAEHIWPVASLAVGDGRSSFAVELFVDRARAVRPTFDLDDNGSELDAVVEICQRLDGIALAIELAAARLVSMTAEDVRDRLGDRFRLLSGGRRGLERHQTLRHAVAWSFDLLDDDERRILCRCSVFADGFDLPAATYVGDNSDDEYAVFDLLDSLVRKSLITVESQAGHARYGVLETIRQFAEEQLAATGDARDTRDRHATYYAERAIAHWTLWDGPRQPVAVDWVDTEFANLRAGFTWSADHDLATAAAIAAHTTFMAYTLQRFEPVSWVETILAAPGAIDLAFLPRLYTAATACQYTGRVDAALQYADAALALQDDHRYDPFEAAWTRIWQGNAHRLAGHHDEFMQIVSELSDQRGVGQVWALSMLLYTSPVVAADQAAEARANADATIRTVRNHGNPYYIALATVGYGRRVLDHRPGQGARGDTRSAHVRSAPPPHGRRGVDLA